ncbi:hypothetical protein [Taibaiella soli]|uniref:Uncharacterized protein n=1 Tax=Taibaiella soli TaxID=1649169 RepID=A0A2W2BCF6_9BACT|nr:hypothetical protein [Taibaiella soli]PZF73909.1 hypothetical protein DN068_06085 [Taibaiella soli]
MKNITTQVISNHPVFTDVVRTVLVDSFQPVASREEFRIVFTLRYEKNGVDITDTMSQPAVNVISANNNINLLLRDEHFNPIPDPNWNGTDANTEFLTMPGYDFVAQLFDQPISIVDLLKRYILVNDADGFFN